MSKKIPFGLATSVILVLLIPPLVSLYVTSQPSVCRICHEMRDESAALLKSSHQKVSCRTCHEERGVTGWLVGRLDGQRMVLAWLFGSYKRPVRANLEDENCLSCHRKDIKTTRISNGIRNSHRQLSSAKYRCTDCHNSVAHGRAIPLKNGPTIEKCAQCHNGDLASNKCELCHPSEMKLMGRSRAPWNVTHGSQWKSAHGMGNLGSCALCHSTQFCSRCHKIELPHTEVWWEKHGLDAIAFPGVCQTCHSKELCNACHQSKMPHPTSWLKDHPKEAEKSGEKSCLTCHRERNCQNCHERHAHPYGMDRKVPQ